MTLPNFLIVGAMKGGTTSLYRYLAEHPQVFMSAHKEPQFFCFEGRRPNMKGPGVLNDSVVTDLAEYEKLFDGAGACKAIGEASTGYLHQPIAAERIGHYLPEVKLVMVLRNPVERAFSSFTHALRDRREPITDFSAALDAEPGRIADNWGFLWRYVQIGMYAQQVERYLERFDRAQVRIYLNEDLRDRPAWLLRDLYAFVGVDPDFGPNLSQRYNVSGVPRSRAINALLNRRNPVAQALKPLVPRRLKQLADTLRQRNLSSAAIPDGARQRLIEVFRADVTRLASLIGRDLSAWLNDEPRPAGGR